MGNRNLVLTLQFKELKHTKNTVRFEEVPEEEGAPVNLGALYVSKWCLKNLGWEPGDELVVQLGLVSPSPRPQGGDR